jgi:hypothetical protein
LTFKPGTKTISAIIAVAVIAVALSAVLIFSQTPAGEKNTSGQTITPLEYVSKHLETFERRDVALILNNYAGDAEVVWTGESGGLAGRYRGLGAIRTFLTTVLTNSDKVELKSVEMDGRIEDEGRALVTSRIMIRGHNSIIGEFEGEANAKYVLTLTSDGWRIKTESWDFRKFKAEGPGSTAFPQWAALYGRRSKVYGIDPVKDLFWSISDYSPIVIVLAAAGIAAYLFAVRRSDTPAET